MEHKLSGEEPRTRSEGRTKKAMGKIVPFLPVIVIFLVSFAAYANTLVNDFVYDDSAQVEKNPWIRDIRYLPDMFTSSVWSFESGTVTSNYYRPMMNVMFMINYHIFGLRPWGFHLVNTLFHAVNSIVVFLLASRLLAHRAASSSPPSPPLAKGGTEGGVASTFLSPPFVAALLFAVHPIHVEAVAWVSALPELSFSLFCLFSLYFSIGGEAVFDRMYLFSLAFFSLALFCKETAVTLPALLIAYDLTFRKNSSFRAFWRRYLPYFAVSAGYLALRFYALGGFAPAKRHTHLSAFEYLINVFPLFAQYIEKLFLPINLNAFYIFHPVAAFFEARFLFSLAVTLLCIAFGVVSWRRSPAAFFSLLLLAVPLLPVLYIPSLGENTFTERYAYLPSFGFLLFISLSFDRLRKKIPGHSLVIVFVLAALTGIYSFQTVKRNTVWKNPLVFFTDMTEKSPHSAMAQSSLGLVLFQEGRADEAIAHYREAIRVDPSYAGSYNNLGVIFMDRGWLDKAAQMFQTSLRISPDNAEARTNLGLTYAKMGLFDKAIEQYKMAAQLRPNFAEAYNNLGLVYAESGWIDKAIEQYRIALKLNPEYAAAHGNLGAAYAKAGMTDRAVEEFMKAIKLNPGNADAHYNLGLALYTKGAKERAIAEFKITAGLQPDHPTVNDILGVAYADLGLFDNAIECFEKSVKLHPANASNHFNLGIAYKKKGIFDKAIVHLQAAATLAPSDGGFRSELADARSKKKQETLRP